MMRDDPFKPANKIKAECQMDTRLGRVGVQTAPGPLREDGEATNAASVFWR